MVPMVSALERFHCNKLKLIFFDYHYHQKPNSLKMAFEVLRNHSIILSLFCILRDEMFRYF